MGEVWVAKQSEPVKRKVAVKVIKKGMNSRAVSDRIEQERQALATNHLNIVPNDVVYCQCIRLANPHRVA